MVIFPELNTIAFGGVATGSIKAHEAAIAAPAKSGKVSTPKETLNVTKTGKIKLAVAVLEVISVKKLITVMTKITIAKAGKNFKCTK